MRKLRILWHSVSPFIRSGYGKVTYNITSRLAKLGYQVIVSAYYGVEPGGMLEIGGCSVVSSKEGSFGVISAARYAEMFKTNIQILTTDWWAFPQFPKLMEYPVLHSPMDHINYPEEILEFTRLYKHIISICKWQQANLRKVGIESTYIPHGVDLSVYKPLNKEKCKELYGVKDKFVFGTVAANSDKEDRKAHTRMMKAMYWFLENNPDVRKDIVWLYHTVPNDPKGLPLDKICRKWGLKDVVRFMDPSLSTIYLTEEQMAVLYNAMDTHLLCSKREGFGLPILESMACGVPNICHDFSSMTELVKDRGWLVKSLGADLNLETTPLNAETAVPDVYDIADKIARAFFKDKERERYSKRARAFALKFNWDDLVMYKWHPLLQGIAEKLFDESAKLKDGASESFAEIMDDLREALSGGSEGNSGDED